MQVFCRVEHWFFGKCWAAFIFVLNFFALHMKFLYKSFFLSTDIHLSTTSHSRVSSHFHRHIFKKKKKNNSNHISTDFALILSPSNHLHQIKYLIQSLYPFLFGSCLTILSMQERWKKKKICWVSNIVSSLFSRFAEWYMYNSFYRSGLRLLCDFLHLNMFLYSSRQYSTIRLW